VAGSTSDVTGELADQLSTVGFQVHSPGSDELPGIVAAHGDHGLLAVDVVARSDDALVELNRKVARLRNDMPGIDRTPTHRAVVALDAGSSSQNIWTLADARAGRLLAALPRHPLDQTAFRALETYFAPRVSITVPRRVPMEDADSSDRAEKRLVLDAQQSAVATRATEDIMIVSGPPGSGKTLVLVARAKWLASQHRDWRIVILCYNRLLVPYLRELAWGHANIDVLTFGQFTSRLRVRVSLDNEEWAERGVAHALRQLSPQYDAVLVDEWQDFMNPWTRLVLATVKEGRGGVTLAGDPNQALYRDADPASVLRGRNVEHVALERPYRSTRQILEVTSALDETMAVSGREQAFEGRPVDLVWAENVTEIVRAVARDIELLLAHEERTPQEIGILVTRKWDIGTVLYALNKAAIPARAVYPNQAEDFDLSEPSVKVMTVHSAKGYEFDVVFLVGMEYLRDLDGSERAEHEGRTGYVGATRAKDQLVLTYSRENSYLDRIRSLPEDLVQRWVWPDDYPEVS
jgi:DNA polymerase III delta prime subunit